MFGKFFSSSPMPLLWNSGLALGAFAIFHSSKAAFWSFFFFFVIFKEGSASSVTLPIGLFFFHSARWFPLLLPFACGCSQNMCMSSDVIVTKDNSLRRQEINAGKGGGDCQNR